VGRASSGGKEKKKNEEFLFNSKPEEAERRGGRGQLRWLLTSGERKGSTAFFVFRRKKSFWIIFVQ